MTTLLSYCRLVAMTATHLFSPSIYATSIRYFLPGYNNLDLTTVKKQFEEWNSEFAQTVSVSKLNGKTTYDFGSKKVRFKARARGLGSALGLGFRLRLG
jgi:hypothetical protein